MSFRQHNFKGFARALHRTQSGGRRVFYIRFATRLSFAVLVTLLLQGASFQSMFAQTANETVKEELLESSSRAVTSAHALPAPKQLRIVSYNIRWRGGEDLQRLIQLFKTDDQIGGAHIIGLQEVDRNRTRTKRENTVRIIAEALSWNYVWAAPPPPGAEKNGDAQHQRTNAAQSSTKTADEFEEETGVALLSPYPLTNVERLVLPHPGPGGRHRAAVGATVHIGTIPVRVYSVHAETRIPVAEKVEQLQAVLDSLARAQTPATMTASNVASNTTLPAVILGDFNTWQPDSKRDTIKLFTQARFATPFTPGHTTFRRSYFGVPIKFRLDWIWLRGFPAATSSGIARDITISDHFPLWLEVPMIEDSATALPRSNHR